MTPPSSNVIGRHVSRERYQRGWTQDELVTKLQLLGCYMTRDILANIETRRCIVTDKQMEFLAEVFGIQIQQLFPATRHFVGKEPEFQEPKHRRHKAKTRLARRRKK
jgi:transcriptional regulator with XRE-family HTH domain